MYFANRVRCWRRVGFCSLLCLGITMSATAQAQGETATTPTKPAQASAATPPANATPSSAQKSAGHSSTHAATHASTSASSRTAARKSKTAQGRKGSKQVARKRGQQAIDSERARAIQTALIREHYMDGEPSGSWDSATQAAMQRYQSDQGWQSKTIPDARALIKLGLGPSHDHLLNPESAMTMPTATPAASAADNPKTAAKPQP
jgi:hypothetical protein